jgi:hypothetical protein
MADSCLVGSEEITAKHLQLEPLHICIFIVLEYGCLQSFDAEMIV